MTEKTPIVWTDPRFGFEHQSLKDKKSAFRDLIISTEPGFDFQPWASELYLAEQWSREGNYSLSYSLDKDKLSGKINSYLNQLDELERTQPIIAIKIAAILRTINSNFFNISKQVDERILAWLIKSEIPLLVKIELGILISKNWPDQFLNNNAFKEVDSIVFDLLLEQSKIEPSLALRAIHDICELNEHQIFYFISGSRSFYKIVNLAENIKHLDPLLSCSMFSSFLLDSRIFSDSNVPEIQRREVADKLWSLSTKLENKKAVRFYSDLIRHGYPDSEWWTELLEKTRDACKNNPDREFICTLAVHAPIGSNLLKEAIELYEQEITRIDAGLLQEFDI